MNSLFHFSFFKKLTCQFWVTPSIFIGHFTAYFYLLMFVPLTALQWSKRYSMPQCLMNSISALHIDQVKQQLPQCVEFHLVYLSSESTDATILFLRPATAWLPACKCVCVIGGKCSPGDTNCDRNLHKDNVVHICLLCVDTTSTVPDTVTNLHRC